MKILNEVLVLITAVYVVFGHKRSDITVISSKNHLIQFPLPSMDVISPSLELALNSCQDLFKWDRWNCPSSDFLSKRNSERFDREAAFVRALTTAAVIYTVTKMCSSGQLPGCGCSDEVKVCSDDPEFAEKLVEQMFNDMQQTSLDAQGYAKMHNSRAGRIAVRNSLVTHCRCDDNYDDNDLNLNCVEGCWNILKNFSEISIHIRRMYNNALLLKVHNSGLTDWSSIPKNTLVFVNESPNYCLRGSITGWLGMEGRQCSRAKGQGRSLQERRSCKNLCRECGFRVKSKVVITHRKCNCNFVWCCEVKCDTCENVETEYYCD